MPYFSLLTAAGPGKGAASFSRNHQPNRCKQLLKQKAFALTCCSFIHTNLILILNCLFYLAMDLISLSKISSAGEAISP